ncbi:hypothetical protein Tco_1032924 [Tanacetum coccineum]|uniref:Uncharacterized protein n=1 Tax=Tanacetum coccineum TaxID=301880 RepID=A0ABQ5GE84_9ASTR
MESIRSNVLQRWLILRIEDFVGSLGQCLAYQTERGLGGLKFLALNRALFFEWCGASFLGRWLFMRYSGFDFSSHCKKRIGDGSCTSFWYDIWLADAPLCVQFPRLFALELDKENCRVANKMELLYGPQLLFAGTLRDGAERAAVGDLSSIMKSVVLSLPTRVYLSRRGVSVGFPSVSFFVMLLWRMFMHVFFRVTWLGLFFVKNLSLVGYWIGRRICSLSDWVGLAWVLILSTCSSRLKSYFRRCFSMLLRLADLEASKSVGL